MPIALASYIDLYDELLKRGYEGNCGEKIHDECCPYGIRIKLLVLREIHSQEHLEEEKRLEGRIMWMMEQDKVEIFRAFFDKAFWGIPFRHAAEQITKEGIDSFVSYLRNCLSLGPVETVLQKMKNEVQSQLYEEKGHTVREVTEAAKPPRKRGRKGVSKGKGM